MELSKQIFKKQGKGYHNLYLYYSKSGKQLYLPVGVRVEEKYYLYNKKTKVKSISSKHPDYIQILRTIKVKHDDFEELLKKLFYEFGEKPEVSIVEFHMKKEADSKKKEKMRIYRDLLDYYDEFLIYKERFVKDPQNSLSKYYNLKDALTKFRDLKNVSLQFINIDEAFLFKFVNFLLTEKVNARRKTNVKVGLSNNSCIDAIKNFIQFLKYAVNEKKVDFNVFTFEENLKVVKMKMDLMKTETSHMTLSQRELEYLYNFQYLNPKVYNNFSTSERFYLDFFIFSCLQGPSYCDGRKIQKHNIKDGRIVDIRSKTGEKFTVEINPISLEILEKWNYDFTHYREDKKVYKNNDGKYNIALKLIFRRFFTWYAPIYKKETGKEFQLSIDVERKRGLESDITHLNRWDLMTSHCARTSFITILASNADEEGLKKVMKRAGHKKIETTLGYIQGSESDMAYVIQIKKLPFL